jgi:hypothetical protein
MLEARSVQRITTGPHNLAARWGDVSSHASHHLDVKLDEPVSIGDRGRTTKGGTLSAPPLSRNSTARLPQNGEVCARGSRRF